MLKNKVELLQTPRFNNNSIRAGGKSKSQRVIQAIKQNKIGAGAGKTRTFKAVAGDFKVKTLPTQLFLHTSPNNSKCRAGKRSSINKMHVFKRDVKLT